MDYLKNKQLLIEKLNSIQCDLNQLFNDEINTEAIIKHTLLILASGSHAQLTKLIKLLSQAGYNGQLSIITKFPCKLISQKTIKYKFIYYKSEKDFHHKNLNCKHFELNTCTAICVLCNNFSGLAYNNVWTIIKKTACKKQFIFNSQGKFFELHRKEFLQHQLAEKSLKKLISRSKKEETVTKECPMEARAGKLLVAMLRE